MAPKRSSPKPGRPSKLGAIIETTGTRTLDAFEKNDITDGAFPVAPAGRGGMALLLATEARVHCGPQETASFGAVSVIFGVNNQPDPQERGKGRSVPASDSGPVDLTLCPTTEDRCRSQVE